MMNYMKLIKRVAYRLPITKEFIEHKDELIKHNFELEKIIHDKQENIQNLLSRILQLEARNKEWDEEVRELRGQNKKLEILWPVAKHDLNKVDNKKIIESSKVPTKKTKSDTYIINWIIPPGHPHDGGIINIFRFVKSLANKGHSCNIYVYDPLKTNTNAASIFEKEFPMSRTTFSYGVETITDCDAIFATSWTTAYPVFNLKSKAKKFYFVQDFEPYFFPVGAESTFAENTYKLGLHGITAGAWLSKKLSMQYGMKCDHYDFGADQLYNYVNAKKRQKILFYARPVSPRRGFELGVAAIELFLLKHPEYEVNMAGWDLTGYELPFKYKNLKSLPLSELNELYNQCAAGLVISFTNMSLLPLELLAAGCIPVVNDQENNTLVSSNSHIKYVQPYPNDIADGLSEIVSRADLPVYAKKGSESAHLETWETACGVVQKIIKRELHG